MQKCNRVCGRSNKLSPYLITQMCLKRLMTKCKSIEYCRRSWSNSFHKNLKLKDGCVVQFKLNLNIFLKNYNIKKYINSFLFICRTCQFSRLRSALELKKFGIRVGLSYMGLLLLLGQKLIFIADAHIYICRPNKWKKPFLIWVVCHHFCCLDSLTQSSLVNLKITN